jgi:hypothetical protein
MPTFLSSEYVWATMLIQMSTAVVTALLFFPISWRKHGKLSAIETIAVLVALSFIGIITGYLTGLSRTPVVGAVLPAVLTVIGGLVLFIVTREAPPEFRTLTATCTIALMLNLLLGSLWGSLSRDDPNNLSILANNQELIRQAICYKRLAFEVEVREERLKQGLADVNATLLVPGCTPPFGDHPFVPNTDGDSNSTP